MYYTTAPIYQPKLIDKIFAHSMKTSSIMLSPEELLCITPDVHAKYHKAITPKCVLNEHCSVSFTDSPDLDLTQQKTCYGELLKLGMLFIPDPYDIYLYQLEPGQEAKPLTVAKESHTLQSIMGQVENGMSIERTLNSSAQVIAMLEALCHHLVLSYDLTV